MWAFSDTRDHLAIVRAAAPQKLAVIVEKPLAISWAAAAEMSALAEEHHSLVLTNYETSWYQSFADARAMLAYAWDGVPLPVEHGFPLRLYVPGRYGMKQPKWITSIDAVAQWAPGYWVARGWSREGLVEATAAVDAVVRQGDMAEVGGMAFAGAKGVAKVEVRGDGGEWREAQLRQPLGDLTWVVWRARMPKASTYEARVVPGVSSRA